MQVAGYAGRGARWYGADDATRGVRTTDYVPPDDFTLQYVWRWSLVLKRWARTPWGVLAVTGCLDLRCGRCGGHRDPIGPTSDQERCTCDGF